MLTQERLKEVVRYDPESGIFTNRINRKGLGGKRGERAGYLDSKHSRGGAKWRLGLDGTSYGAHRLAFLYMTGSFPKSRIFRKNGDTTDDRWDNLSLRTPCVDCGDDNFIGGKNTKCWPCVLASKLKFSDVFQTKAGTSRSIVGRLAREAVAHRPQECVICGFEFPDVCHIKAWKDFPDSAYVSEINHPNNLVLLCPNHHRLFDKGLLVSFRT